MHCFPAQGKYAGEDGYFRVAMEDPNPRAPNANGVSAYAYVGAALACFDAYSKRVGAPMHVWAHGNPKLGSAVQPAAFQPAFQHAKQS